MKFINQARKYGAAVTGSVGLAVFSIEASAASVLTAADKTAITDGFTGLTDTVKDIVSVSWAPMLIIVAVLAAPSIVKKIVSIAKS